MKAQGYLNLKTKTGSFPHVTENHSDDYQCEKCGAIFCAVKGCGNWQEVSLSGASFLCKDGKYRKFSENEDIKLPKGICEFCL